MTTTQTRARNLKAGDRVVNEDGVTFTVEETGVFSYYGIWAIGVTEYGDRARAQYWDRNDLATVANDN